MAGGLMKGGITARQLDYFALLVGASIVALFSAAVATLWPEPSAFITFIPVPGCT
jgi:hypothetical protein